MISITYYNPLGSSPSLNGPKITFCKVLTSLSYNFAIFVSKINCYKHRRGGIL